MNPTVTTNFRGETLTGKFSGRWTIGEEIVDPATPYKRFYRCVCSCEKATEKLVERVQLLKGASKSCGCLRTELLVARSTTHGAYYSSEHKSWSSMITRCTNPNYREFHLYGGRGITVCSEWLASFEKFLQDMGPKPSPTHAIDRIDNSLGYYKENCRWATLEQNARNKRNTITVQFEGELRSLAELAETYNIDYHAIYYRYTKGDREYDLIRASGTPKQSK